MKVLLISQYLSGGGLERMVHLLGAELVRQFNTKVILYSFEKGSDAELVKNLQTQKMTVIHSEKSRGFSFKTIAELIKLVREEKVDVLHSHETAPLMYCVFVKFLCGRRIRLIHTQHSFIHLKFRRFIRFYDCFFQFFANQVTVVSQQVQDEYQKIGVPLERVKIIANGVEFPERFLSESEKKNFRKILMAENAVIARANDDAIWLLALARVHPRKGQDHLIRMWEKLPSAIREKSFLIFTGPETSEGELQRLKAIMQDMQHKERILFTGSTAQPVAWLLAADLFLSGSEYEGMPLSPIEACGAGIPLVLSQIEGHQVLSHCARYFPFDNPTAAAEQVTACLSEKEKDPTTFTEKLHAGAKAVQERYSIATMAKDYYSLYQG